MDAKERDFADERGRRVRDELDEGVRPRRPWLLIIASILLAGLATWSGFQSKRGAEQEAMLRAELRQVYQEAEQLRTQAAQSQQRVALLEKQVAALTAEREAATKRLEELEAALARLQGRKPKR